MNKKFFHVVDSDGDRVNYDKKLTTREDAEAWARDRAASNESGTYYIMEAVAIVQQPKPPVEIVTL